MRRLIVCADGTWNRPDAITGGAATPTNVVKIAHAILPIDSRGISQVTFYLSGVGTRNSEDKLFGGAFGRGLDEHIRQCYRFLIHNYAPGDELYFFGFSRGAYTVRSLAGLVRNSGILKKDLCSEELNAFELYRTRKPASGPNSEAAIAFRAACSQDVPITCIGVWDTVGALGLPIELFKGRSHAKYQFHDVTLSGRVRNAFHALAIDERRRPFRPTLWEQPLDDLDRNWLEQAWFCGVHCNVGGGYPDSSLSDVTLKWMIDRVTDRCSLEFDQAFVARTVRPSPLGELYDSMKRPYKLIGALERRIDEKAAANLKRGVNTWEYVHESAYRRAHERLTGAVYRPNNLAEYLERSDPKPLIASALPNRTQPTATNVA